MPALYETVIAKTDASLKAQLNDLADQGYRAIHIHAAGGVFCAVLEREIGWRELVKSKAHSDVHRHIIEGLIAALDLAVQTPDDPVGATRRMLAEVYRTKGNE